MYVFYYGYYRVATVGLEPGDALFGTAKLPELKLADMKKLEQMVLDGTVPSPVPGTDPSTPPPVRRDSREAQPGRGRAPADVRPSERERTRGSIPMAENEDGVTPATGWLDQAAKRTVDLKVDAIFLDATPVSFGQQGLAGEERVRYQAVLRNQFGQILFRQPELERSAASYKRMEASAKLGERQGAPEIKPESIRPTPGDRQPDRAPRKPPSGGGGG